MRGADRWHAIRAILLAAWLWVAVAEAHAAGKDRLTKQVESEKRQCGFSDSASTPTAPAPTASE